MFCHKCGNQSLEGAEFCQKCGEKLLKDDTPQASVESVSTAPASTVTPIPTVSRIIDFIKSKVKNPKWSTVGIAVVAVVAVIVIVAALSGENGGDNSSTSNKPISVTFGSTFRYLGIEYTIGDNWDISGSEAYGCYIKIPVKITNISNANNTSDLWVNKTWTPNDVTTSGAIGTGGEMRPGASQNGDITLYYEGDGDYVLELTRVLRSEVEVIITLPITRYP
jgi:hypothetical protein